MMIDARKRAVALPAPHISATKTADVNKLRMKIVTLLVSAHTKANKHLESLYGQGSLLLASYATLASRSDES